MDDALPPLPTLIDTGSVLRREAIAHGLAPDELERLLRRGVLVRIRRGAYAQTARWSRLGPVERHLVTARAVLRSLEEPAVLGHVSAAVALGLPVWGADLSRVHVIRDRTRQGARVEGGVVHHAARLPQHHIADAGGIPVTSATRTIVDHARTVSFEAGVVTADAALQRGLTSKSELKEMLGWQMEWPGSRAASRVTTFADGLAESVGESRGRVCMAGAGLPTPELQVAITDGGGGFVGRVDFLFRAQRTIGEFDGRVKYRLDVPGNRVEDVLWQEKRREDALRALGYEVVRFTWEDLERAPREIRRRFLAAFARAAARTLPTAR